MKNLKSILIILLFLLSFSNKSFSFYNDSLSFCDKALKIDIKIFKNNNREKLKLHKIVNYKKTNRTLRIATKNKIIKFKNEYDGIEPIIIYEFYGKLESKKWIFVKETKLNSEKYYLINTLTSKIDILIGEPRIFENEIVCLEGSYTDSPRILEVYSIVKSNLTKIFKMSLSNCKDLITAESPYLLNNKIYLTDLESKAWTIEYK